MSAEQRDPKQNEFLQESQEERGSFLSDYFAFLKRTRKWWMLPVLVVVLLFGLLVVLSATGAAPFIYTLF
jgi:uncharacterized protein involved in exopolysaccharide biosynthesis